MITFTSSQSKYLFNNAYTNAYTINSIPAEDLKQMCGYSVPSVPPHLGSSKARTRAASAIGPKQTPVVNSERVGICTTSPEISPKVRKIEK